MKTIEITKSQLATLRGLRKSTKEIAEALQITQTEVVGALKHFDLYIERKSSPKTTEKAYEIELIDDVTEYDTVQSSN